MSVKFQISEVIFRATDNCNDVGHLSVSRGTKNVPLVSDDIPREFKFLIDDSTLS